MCAVPPQRMGFFNSAPGGKWTRSGRRGYSGVFVFDEMLGHTPLRLAPYSPIFGEELEIPRLGGVACASKTGRVTNIKIYK